MLKSISEELSLLLVTNKIISIDNREFYIYGIQLILYDFLIFITIFLISLATKTLPVSLTFSTVFCLLRAYAGGYHCKTFFRCFCTSISIYLLMLIINSNFHSILLILSIILIVCALPVIIIFAPVEHENNPLSKFEKHRYRLISLLLTTGAILLYLIFIRLNAYDFSFCVSWVIFATAILILISKLRSDKNEKTVS